MAGLPTITLPDFETLVLDRLKLCLGEISGLNRVFRQPPVNALPQDAFPLAYVLAGAMLNAIPTDLQAAGSVIVNRNYVIRILGSPIPNTTDQSVTDGAQGYIDIDPFFNRMRSYFLSHPRLETTILDALEWVYEDIVYNDLGIVERPAPAGVNHFAIECTLIVSQRARMTRLG